MSGNDGEEVTPVPIPNTEVKLFSADGSWGSPPVRVGRCQAKQKTNILVGLFLYVKEKSEGLNNKKVSQIVNRRRRSKKVEDMKE